MLRLLMVDDERDIADSITAGLRMKGYEVDVFYDPVDALANFKKGTYDLVISDIKMPKMNGFELLYELKKIDPYVQVILLTGYVDLMREVNKLFTKLNVRDVIEKPIGMQQLEEKIKALGLGDRQAGMTQEARVSRSAAWHLRLVSHESRWTF